MRLRSLGSDVKVQGMASEEELFASVDALLNEEPHLPPPAERARLREAAGITQARLATALKTTTQSVKNWENGRSDWEKSGKKYPIMVPMSIEIRIHLVSEIPRRVDQSVRGGVGVMGGKGTPGLCLDENDVSLNLPVHRAGAEPA